MKQTSLQGIANKATQNKTYRFRNLFGMLTVGYLFWCWDFINKKASAGVDRIDAQAYEANLLPNIDQLVLRSALKKGDRFDLFGMKQSKQYHSFPGFDCLDLVMGILIDLKDQTIMQ